MATPDQAKQAVVHEWDDWVRTQPIEGIAIGRDAFKFFLGLRAKRGGWPVAATASGWAGAGAPAKRNVGVIRGKRLKHQLGQAFRSRP
jgi:hypothetical protein